MQGPRDGVGAWEHWCTLLAESLPAGLLEKHRQVREEPVVLSWYGEAREVGSHSLLVLSVSLQSCFRVSLSLQGIRGFWVGVGLVYLKYFYPLTFCM